MYHFPEGDKRGTMRFADACNRMAQKFQQEIDEDPTDATPYNQWAWLVSNTEGDFQKAIRYSHRSLGVECERRIRLGQLSRYAWPAATTPPATTRTR